MQKTVLRVFLLALSLRAVFAIGQMIYGINNSLNFESYLYGPFNSGLELYHDFYFYYMAQLADIHNGLIPYRDFAYSYPPLFLYSMYPFFVIGGSKAASLVIWVADAATAPLIYLAASHFTNSKLSLVAGISYAVSPFFLLYEGYLWLSSQPMTFFMVLSIYLLLTRRPLLSAVAFAISVLFKQELIVLVPIYVIWYLNNVPRKTLLKAIATFSLIIFALSLPFLIISPAFYASSISYGQLGQVSLPPNYFIGTDSVSQPGNSVASHPLICNTLSNTWRSSICSYGNFTYTDVKLTPSWTMIFSAGFMNNISQLIFLPLLAIALYTLVRLRRDPSMLFLSGALALSGFLGVFTLFFHDIYRYYLIPIYIFPLVCSRTRISSSIAICIPLLSLVLPSGSIQLLLPLIDIIAVAIMNQKAISTSNQSSSDKGLPFVNYPVRG